MNLLEEEEEEIIPSEVEDTAEAAAEEEVDTATLRKKISRKRIQISSSWQWKEHCKLFSNFK